MLNVQTFNVFNIEHFALDIDRCFFTLQQLVLARHQSAVAQAFRPARR